MLFTKNQEKLNLSLFNKRNVYLQHITIGYFIAIELRDETFIQCDKYTILISQKYTGFELWDYKTDIVFEHNFYIVCN